MPHLIPSGGFGFVSEGDAWMFVADEARRWHWKRDRKRRSPDRQDRASVRGLAITEEGRRALAELRDGAVK